jgi:signal peptidase II
MQQTKRAVWILGVMIVVTILDQLTKVVAMEQLKGHPPVVFWGNLFRFEYAENPGAFLSLGATLSPEMRLWTLSIAVAIFLLFLFIYVIRTRSLGKVQTWALAFVLGGGVSNLIDRFFRPSGRVIDFMNTGIGDLRTGVFNVADMLIMAGIGVFLVLNIRTGPENAAAAKKRS